MSNKLIQRKYRRKQRVSANIHGTAERPRISVYRSNAYIYAQVIDDVAQKTLVAQDVKQLKPALKGVKVEQAKAVGIALAKKMKAAGITMAVFDRGRFAYNGRVKALAEGVREGGIQV